MPDANAECFKMVPSRNSSAVKHSIKFVKFSFVNICVISFRLELISGRIAEERLTLYNKLNRNGLLRIREIKKIFCSDSIDYS